MSTRIYAEAKIQWDVYADPKRTCRYSYEFPLTPLSTWEQFRFPLLLLMTYITKAAVQGYFKMTPKWPNFMKICYFIISLLLASPRTNLQDKNVKKIQLDHSTAIAYNIYKYFCNFCSKIISIKENVVIASVSKEETELNILNMVLKTLRVHRCIVFNWLESAVKLDVAGQKGLKIENILKKKVEKSESKVVSGHWRSRWKYIGQTELRDEWYCVMCHKA